jgi:hypothetical protein
MTREDAKQILKICRDVRDCHDTDKVELRTTIGNTVWVILRGFNFSHDDIIAMYEELECELNSNGE